ncbi:NADP-dependent oxidoreductase [Streptomyces sp. NPDC051362]|uniref:NADP-dependent oxidoreductase n=1 Tax=Streptomyces sp. NPDC051362 TaxID=3365651 RepID=UPI0037B14E9F
MPKAYVYTSHGGPETEKLIDMDRPTAGPGEILVAVRAAGVNPADWKLRSGMRAASAFPVVFGTEAAGVVEEVGEGVTAFSAGDAVFGRAVAGSYAEYALLQAPLTAHIPEGLSFNEAAVLPVAAVTAYVGIRQLALPTGSTVLVTGAGGGVGVAAVQIARAFGLQVIGTASESKKEFLESLGAVHVASGPHLAARAWAAAMEGVDGVFDLIGGDDLGEVATLLVDPSKLITAVAAPQEVGRLGGAFISRDRDATMLEEVARLVQQGDLDTCVTQVFPLEQAGLAVRAVEEGHARGKIVITPGK